MNDPQLKRNRLDPLALRLNADFKLLSPETQQRILQLRSKQAPLPSQLPKSLPKLSRDR